MISVWHVIILLIVFGIPAAIIARIRKEKLLYWLLGAITVTVIVLILIYRPSTASAVNSTNVHNRSMNEATASIKIYSEEKRNLISSTIMPLMLHGRVLASCVENAHYGTQAGLSNYRSNIDKIIVKGKEAGTITDDMIIDVNALIEGSISSTSGQLTTSDCDQAINFLSATGMLQN